MRYWWVNQKQTHRHEIGGGYLWSPKRRADQSRNRFYDNMKEVAPGDVVFSYWQTAIRAYRQAAHRRGHSHQGARHAPHACEAMVADGQHVFLGSQNFTLDCIGRNREVGDFISSAPVAAVLAGYFAQDTAA